MFRAPKLPVTPEEQQWIEDSFCLLIDLFGENWITEAPLVLPNKQFFPREYENTEAWARDAFGRVCELMRVDPVRVYLKFDRDPWHDLRKARVHIGETSGAAGLYHEVPREGEPSCAVISIKDSLIEDPEGMVATMSHELSHVLLLGDGKIPRTMEKMEPLTDLMTVFSGFGVFTANSAHVHRSGGGGWSVSNRGVSLAARIRLRLGCFRANQG